MPSDDELLLEGAAEERARTAGTSLAHAWRSGRGVESALAAAAAADAAKAADDLKAERRRGAPPSVRQCSALLVLGLLEISCSALFER